MLYFSYRSGDCGLTLGRLDVADAGRRRQRHDNINTVVSARLITNRILPVTRCHPYTTDTSRSYSTARLPSSMVKLIGFHIESELTVF